MGDEALFRSLETDASAFVAKTASTAEVLAAIRHAAVATSSFTAAGLPHALAWQTGEHDRSGLGPRESEGHRLGDGMSVPEIACSMFIRPPNLRGADLCEARCVQTGRTRSRPEFVEGSLSMTRTCTLKPLA